MKIHRKIFEKVALLKNVHNEKYQLFFKNRLNQTATDQIADKFIRDGAYYFDDPWELRAFCLNKCPQGGILLEFGVFKGGSINFFAKRTDRTIYGFDSFEGLPSGEGIWNRYFVKKSFDLKGNLPEVERNVKLIPGWIEDSLPVFLEETQENISFVHIDVDIYKSASFILEAIADRLMPGSVIIFDEYFNYDGFYNHEYRAFMEFISTTDYDYKYIGASANRNIFGAFGKMGVIVN